MIDTARLWKGEYLVEESMQRQQVGRQCMSIALSA